MTCLQLGVLSLLGILSTKHKTMQAYTYDRKFDASIPGNGFRLADKYNAADSTWDRTCLDFLKAGDIFRLVPQGGETNGKVLRVVEPLELVRVRDFSKLLPNKDSDTNATKLAYYGGRMKFEEASDAAR